MRAESNELKWLESATLGRVSGTKQFRGKDVTPTMLPSSTHAGRRSRKGSTLTDPRLLLRTPKVLILLGIGRAGSKPSLHRACGSATAARLRTRKKRPNRNPNYHRAPDSVPLGCGRGVDIFDNCPQATPIQGSSDHVLNPFSPRRLSRHSVPYRDPVCPKLCSTAILVEKQTSVKCTCTHTHTHAHAQTGAKKCFTLPAASVILWLCTHYRI